MSSKFYLHPFVIIGRIIRHALHNIYRTAGIAVITVTILVLALVSVNALLSVRALTTSAVAAIGEQVDLTIYFTPAATQEQIDGVKKYVAQFSELSSVDLVDRAQALEKFKVRHKDNESVLKSLELLPDNPFGAHLVLRARDTSKYDRIIRSIEQQPWQSFIQRRSFADRALVIGRINVVTTRAEQLSLWLAGLFILIALLIIFNAVRMAIYTQRDEISIKKLVGATNGFIRAPFFVEAFLYAAVSVAVTAAILWTGAKIIDPYLGTLFTSGGFSIRGLFFDHWARVFGAQLGIVVILAWLTAALAMRKYLRA